MLLRYFEPQHRIEQANSGPNDLLPAESECSTWNLSDSALNQLPARVSIIKNSLKHQILIHKPKHKTFLHMPIRPSPLFWAKTVEPKTKEGRRSRNTSRRMDTSGNAQAIRIGGNAVKCYCWPPGTGNQPLPDKIIPKTTKLGLTDRRGQWIRAMKPS